MDTFWVVTLFHFQPSPEQRAEVEYKALEEFNSSGIEEFSLIESQVDEILGDRSYSGGDLPMSVIDEVENVVLNKPLNFRFYFSSELEATSFATSIRNSFLCETQVEEKASEDWNAEWKKHYSPIKVNSDLEIIPSWMTEFKSTSRHKIYIYPGMGFGTGSHETTFLCLQLFTKHLLKNRISDVLDFGSGSGILGLSVFNFFPDAQVDFYDVDLEANKNCYQNAQTNQFEDKSFRLLLPEVRNLLKKEYDLVFANILESILIEECVSLSTQTKVGGTLILSGLLKHQTSGIIDAYSSQGLKLMDHELKGDWAALLFQKVAM